MRVGHDTLLHAEFQPRLLGELRIGRDAERDDGEVGVNLPVFRADGELFFRAQSLEGRVQPKIDAMRNEFRVQKARHVSVERRENVVAALNERDVNAPPREVFRRLQSDKSAAHDDRRAGLVPRNEVVQGEGIFHRAERKHARVRRLRRRGNHGLCAGREEQFIVVLLVRPARREVAHRHAPARAVDLHRLVSHTHVYAVAREKGLRRLERERVLFPDRAAHIIGQSAVGVGDVPRAFEHDDLGALVQPADARRGSRAARNAADNDNFHKNLPENSRAKNACAGT